MARFCGRYECKSYIGTENENSWHHVQVLPAPSSAKYLGAAPFRWLNEAGHSWGLTPLSDMQLAVGEDCPYYNSGHVLCDVVLEGDVIVLLGPCGERYYRIGDLPVERMPSPSEVASLGSGRRTISKLNRRRREFKGDHKYCVFVIPLKSQEAEWRDLAFLACIPAASHGQDTLAARPVVIAPSDHGIHNDDSVADFLSRFQPDAVRVFAPSSDQSISFEGFTFDVVNEPCDDLDSVTALLASQWVNANAAVLVAVGDYGSAVMAASFASRIDAPLFFVNERLSETVRTAILHLAPSQVFTIGQCPTDELDFTIVHLASASEVIECLAAHGNVLDYLALFNPNDRDDGISRKLSLTAPLYATRHEGLAIPVLNTPIIPKASDAKEAVHLTIAVLQSIVQQMGRLPEHMALVGSFDVLPVWETESDVNDSKIYAVTDLPYGQLALEKHFREIAVGRIFTDSICSGSLLAARTVTYELLKDGHWERSFMECGKWGFRELSPLFRNVGFDEPEHPDERAIESRHSLEVAAIIHRDHSGPDGLGNAFNTSTSALYAPAILMSDGCHAAGVDEKQPSVASRMLGRGGIAFLGSPRSPTAANTLNRIAFFNALLHDGMTLGQAARSAFNKTTTNWLDNGTAQRYTVENEMMFGDPALKMQVPSAPTKLPADASLEGDVVTITAPGDWWQVPFHPEHLKEWNHTGAVFTYAGPGAEPESRWCGEGYNHQDLFFTVSVTVPKNVSWQFVHPLDAVEAMADGTEVASDPKSWWLSGRHFLHENHDGSHRFYWRVRLLDFDMKTGTIKRRLKYARFKLS